MKTALVLVTALTFFACTAVAEDVDLEIVNRIRTEAFFHSKVMDYAYLLADRNGPRVTGSPGYRRAAEAAVDAFKQAGVEKSEIESWGTFGRGWEWTRVAVQMKSPQETTLNAIPAAFSPGTDGPVRGSVVFAPVWEHDEDHPSDGNLVRVAEQIETWMNAQRGKLKGKIVMLRNPHRWKLPTTPDEFRLSSDDLADLSKGAYALPAEPGPYPEAVWPLIRFPVDPEENSRLWNVVPLEMLVDRWNLDARVNSRIFRFLVDEGVAAVVLPSDSARTSIIFQSGYGPIDPELPVPPPTVTLMPEQYSRIWRLIERGDEVVLEVDVDAELYPDQPGLDVVAEIPGSARRPELVMLGAHLDSWHSATGATDNASGCAVVMEAMRILKTLGVPMRRTVRAALWDGEEQGLLGSRGYVKKHFADPVTMELKPEHALLSAYFNLDNGSGKIRGVYLQQNDMARPIFQAWMAPFAEFGATATTIANTTGTDHLSFAAVGLPGFQFVQDPLDYDVNTHHSNVDDVGHVLEGDLMQAAAVMATAVYQAAQREEMMPRLALPEPLPPKGPLPEILRD